MRKLEKNPSNRICTYLKTYVLENDLESIQTLLTQNRDYDINTADGQGDTMLHWAMQENVSVEIFTAILKLENLNLFSVNIQQQSALQVAIEQKQSTKIKLLLQSAVDHKVLPELNDYLLQAVNMGDAVSAKVLLLYGGEVDAKVITESKNNEIILLFFRFGYGIGIYFKKPEVLKAIEFFADTCLMGAFLDGKKIESELVLSKAILTNETLKAANARLSLVSEVRQNQALTIAQEQAFMAALLARIETEWSYWHENCKDPIQIYQALVDQNWDKVSAWLKGLNTDQVKYLCFLQVMLKQKSEQMGNIYLTNLVEAIPQPVLSLRSLALKKIERNINQHRDTLTDMLQGLPALLQEELCWYLIKDFPKNKRKLLRVAFLNYFKDKDFDIFSDELKKNFEDAQFIYLMSWFNKTKDNVAVQNTSSASINLFLPVLPIMQSDLILVGYQREIHNLQRHLNETKLFWASRAMHARIERNAAMLGKPVRSYISDRTWVVGIFLSAVLVVASVFGFLENPFAEFLYGCTILEEKNEYLCSGRRIPCQSTQMMLPSLNKTIHFTRDGTSYECVERKQGEEIGITVSGIVLSIIIAIILFFSIRLLPPKHARIFPYAKTLDRLDDSNRTSIQALKILLANLAVHYRQQPEAAVLRNAAIQLHNPKLTVGNLLDQLQKVDSAFDALNASRAPALVDRGVCFYPEVKGLATLNSDLVTLGIFAAPKSPTITTNNNNEFELVKITYTGVNNNEEFISPTLY